MDRIFLRRSICDLFLFNFIDFFVRFYVPLDLSFTVDKIFGLPLNDVASG
jgi:hypothetical protein